MTVVSQVDGDRWTVGGDPVGWLVKRLVLVFFGVFVFKRGCFFCVFCVFCRFFLGRAIFWLGFTMIAFARGFVCVKSGKLL